MTEAEKKHGVSVNTPDFSQVLYTLEMSGILLFLVLKAFNNDKSPV